MRITKMKKLPIAAIVALFMVSVVWTQPLAAAQLLETKARPVDFRACNFRDGKSMKDLDKVTEKFREYANKNDFGYSAWTLTPQYHRGESFDVGWLGAWPDGQAFGSSLEKWYSTGTAIAAEFNAVMDCGSWHELAMSFPINAADGAPRDGVVLFYPCTVNEGKTIADAYAAHLEAGTAMKAMGSQALSWLFQPAMGTGAIDFDYYHVVAFNRLAELGATMEMYVNGGGRKKALDILSKVTSCDVPNAYDALSVRADDER
jgi:hypothetical protein